ncbi:hypothetical protein B0H66DRAFT_307921 [Apodospora peruviana]|uniref:CFEM domain-containing protein n=1 Tax=Apodospora peruviana TaxID=516989 RepID=A0AAE0I296_9PEZI|nr:hypothetical protein B0H66DRAFT_307921 [Apodospora peruviana]
MISSQILATLALLSSATAFNSNPSLTTRQDEECGTYPACSELISQYPSCGSECLPLGFAAVGCAEGDYACRCGTGGIGIVKFFQALSPCVQEACGGPSLSNLLSGWIDPVCKCAWANPTTPCPQPSTEPSPIPSPIPSPVPSDPPTGGNPGTCDNTWECQDELDVVASCAIDCVNQFAPEVSCGQNDYNCACANYNELQTLAATCVITSCLPQGVGPGTVINSLTSLCTCVSANPWTEPEACPSGSPVPSVSPSAGPSSVVPSSSAVVVPSSSGVSSSVVVSPSPSASACVPAPPAAPWACEEDFAAVPECAIPIIAAAAINLGCAENDHTCECENAAAIQGAVATDVIAACGIANVGTVLSSVEEFCVCVAANPEPETPAPVEGEVICSSSSPVPSGGSPSSSGAVPSSSGSPGGGGGGSGGGGGGHGGSYGPGYTTSTIYSTDIYTVTECPPKITACPAKTITKSHAVSTTVCPIDTGKPGSPGAGGGYTNSTVPNPQPSGTTDDVAPIYTAGSVAGKEVAVIGTLLAGVIAAVFAL